MENPKTTPLSEIHRKLGAQMVSFAGFEMPLIYEGILKEHLHTRRYASIFDTCHMGVLSLKGPDSIGDVAHLVAGRVAALEEGRCTYGFLLNEQGGIIDDLIVYRTGEQEFMLVVNAANNEKDQAWIKHHISREINFVNLTDTTAKLDLQGPQSARVLHTLGVRNLHALPYYRFRAEKIMGFECILSRSGYTGELGYELYIQRENSVALWELLMGTEPVKPAGLGARDTLRLEAGYPLYGNELSESHTPVEAGLSKFIDKNSDYIGKSALANETNRGYNERLIGFRMEGRQAARHGDVMFSGSETIGKVTSGCFAPSLGYAVGMGFIAQKYSLPDTQFEIQVRSKRLKALCVETPFYKQGTARMIISS